MAALNQSVNMESQCIPGSFPRLMPFPSVAQTTLVIKVQNEPVMITGIKDVNAFLMAHICFCEETLLANVSAFSVN